MVPAQLSPGCYEDRWAGSKGKEVTGRQHSKLVDKRPSKTSKGQRFWQRTALRDGDKARGLGAPNLLSGSCARDVRYDHGLALRFIGRRWQKWGHS